MAIETDAELCALLERVESIAVVGIKAGPADEAFRVPAYLARQGYRILPVSPRLERVLDVACVPTLGALEETPDLIDVFRAAPHIPAHVNEILALPRPPLGVWLQLGIRHDAAAQRLEAAGIAVVQDRCLMLEHARLLPARTRDAAGTDDAKGREPSPKRPS